MKQKGINDICMMMTLATLTGCAAKTTEPETSDGKTANIILDYAQGIADGIYGWTLSEDGSQSDTSGNYKFSDFQLALQENAAYSFAQYIKEKYGKDTSSWLEANADGTYQITNSTNFINGIGLVQNNDIPGFDTLDMSAENDAFVSSDAPMVHYSSSIAKLLQDNYGSYKDLDGFDA